MGDWMRFENLFYLCFFGGFVVFMAFSVPKWFVVIYAILGIVGILYFDRKYKQH